MKKIPTIFERDPEWPSRLLHAANPECGWVFKGQGVPRRKYDGTSCYVGNGQLYRRREVGLRTILPRGTIIVDYGEVKETVIVWWPVDPSDPQDRWHCEAFDRGPIDGEPFRQGTYELVGEKINGNPENISGHLLVRHDSAPIYHDVPRHYDGLREWLRGRDIEGLVFHHPDGRMAKVKKRDFNLPRKPE